MNQMMSWCQPPGQLERCWNDVQAVEEFLIKALTDILAKNPNAFGTVGALVGVTDGSSAAPGQVGELINFEIVDAVSYPANSVDFPTLTIMGTLPAGDWDVQAWVSGLSLITLIELDNVPSTNIDLGRDEDLALLPPGMGYLGAAPGCTMANVFFVPSSLSYYRGAGPVTVILRTVVTSVAAGTLSLGYMARRVR